MKTKIKNKIFYILSIGVFLIGLIFLLITNFNNKTDTKKFSASIASSGYNNGCYTGMVKWQGGKLDDGIDQAIDICGLYVDLTYGGSSSMYEKTHVSYVSFLSGQLNENSPYKPAIASTDIAISNKIYQSSAWQHIPTNYGPGASYVTWGTTDCSQKFVYSTKNTNCHKDIYTPQNGCIQGAIGYLLKDGIPAGNLQFPSATMYYTLAGQSTVKTTQVALGTLPHPECNVSTPPPEDPDPPNCGVLNLSADTSSVNSGSSTYLRWNDSTTSYGYASSMVIYKRPDGESPQVIGSYSISNGTVNANYINSGIISKDTTYYVNLDNNIGKALVTCPDVKINVSTPPPPTPQTPSCTFLNSNTNINYGDSISLNYTTTNAVAITNFTPDPSNIKNSITVGTGKYTPSFVPPQGTTTYTMTVVSSTSQYANCNISITATPSQPNDPPSCPSINLQTAQSSINYNGTIDLSWNNSVFESGDSIVVKRRNEVGGATTTLTTSKSINSFSDPSIKQNVKYEITVDRGGVQRTCQTNYVQVNNADPSCVFNHTSPISINNNQTISLNYSTQNATSIIGFTNATFPLSSISVGTSKNTPSFTPPIGSTTYEMTVMNAQGKTASCNVTTSVTGTSSFKIEKYVGQSAGVKGKNSSFSQTGQKAYYTLVITNTGTMAGQASVRDFLLTPTYGGRLSAPTITQCNGCSNQASFLTGGNLQTDTIQPGNNFEVHYTRDILELPSTVDSEIIDTARLNCSGNDCESSARVTLIAPQTPDPQCNLSPSSQTVTTQGKITFNWEVKNANGAEFDKNPPGVIFTSENPLSSKTGTEEINAPSTPGDYTYRLTARNTKKAGQPSVLCLATVKIIQPPNNPECNLLSFRASRTTPYDSTVKIEWNKSGFGNSTQYFTLHDITLPNATPNNSNKIITTPNPMIPSGPERWEITNEPDSKRYAINISYNDVYNIPRNLVCEAEVPQVAINCNSIDLKVGVPSLGFSPQKYLTINQSATADVQLTWNGININNSTINNITVSQSINGGSDQTVTQFQKPLVSQYLNGVSGSMMSNSQPIFPLLHNFTLQDVVYKFTGELTGGQNIECTATIDVQGPIYEPPVECSLNITHNPSDPANVSDINFSFIGGTPTTAVFTASPVTQNDPVHNANALDYMQTMKISTGPRDQRTEFTLTVSNSSGVTRSCMAILETNPEPNNPPECSISPASAQINYGDTVNLDWVITGGIPTQATITANPTPHIGSVMDIIRRGIDDPNNKEQIYAGRRYQDTTFTMTVSNAYGSNTCDTLVTVIQDRPPPVCESFNVSPSRVIYRQNDPNNKPRADLFWKLGGGQFDEVYIEPTPIGDDPIGNVTALTQSDGSGTRSTGGRTETTRFKLTAINTNLYGQRQQTECYTTLYVSEDTSAPECNPGDFGFVQLGSSQLINTIEVPIYGQATLGWNLSGGAATDVQIFATPGPNLGNVTGNTRVSTGQRSSDTVFRLVASNTSGSTECTANLRIQGTPNYKIEKYILDMQNGGSQQKTLTHGNNEIAYYRVKVTNVVGQTDITIRDTKPNGITGNRGGSLGSILFESSLTITCPNYITNAGNCPSPSDWMDGNVSIPGLRNGDHITIEYQRPVSATGITGTYSSATDTVNLTYDNGSTLITKTDAATVRMLPESTAFKVKKYVSNQGLNSSYNDISATIDSNGTAFYKVVVSNLGGAGSTELTDFMSPSTNEMGQPYDVRVECPVSSNICEGTGFGSFPYTGRANITLGQNDQIIIYYKRDANISSNSNYKNFVNIASVTGDSDDATVTVNSPNNIDVSITKNVYPSNLNVGDQTTYTLNYRNTGGTAENVTINDTWRSNDGSSISNIRIVQNPLHGYCTPINSGITCNLGRLNNGDSGTIQYSGTGDRVGTVDNTVRISTTTTETNLNNNVSNAQIIIRDNTPPPPTNPPSCTIFASPQQVDSIGYPTLISWTANNATSGYIRNDNSGQQQTLNVTNGMGSLQQIVTHSTTRYTITVSNGQETRTCIASVHVKQDPICSNLSFSPQSPIEKNTPFSMYWTSINQQSARIQSSDGKIINIGGSKIYHQITEGISQNTSYTVTIFSGPNQTGTASQISCNGTMNITNVQPPQNNPEFIITKNVSKEDNGLYDKSEVRLSSISDTAYYQVKVKNIKNAQGTVLITDILKSATNGGSLDDMKNLKIEPSYNRCYGTFAGGGITCEMTPYQEIFITYERDVKSLPNNGESKFVNNAKLHTEYCNYPNCEDNATVILQQAEKPQFKVIKKVSKTGNYGSYFDEVGFTEDTNQKAYYKIIVENLSNVAGLAEITDEFFPDLLVGGSIGDTANLRFSQNTNCSGPFTGNKIQCNMDALEILEITYQRDIKSLPNNGKANFINVVKLSDNCIGSDCQDDARVILEGVGDPRFLITKNVATNYNGNYIKEIARNNTNEIAYYEIKLKNIGNAKGTTSIADNQMPGSNGGQILNIQNFSIHSGSGCTGTLENNNFVYCTLNPNQEVIFRYERKVNQMPYSGVSNFDNTVEIREKNLCNPNDCEDVARVVLQKEGVSSCELEKEVSKNYNYGYSNQIEISNKNETAYYKVVLKNIGSKRGSFNIIDSVFGDTNGGQLSDVQNFNIITNNSNCNGELKLGKSLSCTLDPNESVEVRYNRSVLKMPDSGISNIDDLIQNIGETTGVQCKDDSRVVLQTSSPAQFRIDKYDSKYSDNIREKSIELSSTGQNAYYELVVKNESQNNGTVAINDILSAGTNGGVLGEMKNISFYPNVCTGNLSNGGNVFCNLSGGQSVSIKYYREVISMPQNNSTSIFINNARITSNNCSKCNDKAEVILKQSSGFSIEKYISKTNGSGYTKFESTASADDNAYYKVIVKNNTSTAGKVKITDSMVNGVNGGRLGDMRNIIYTPNVCTGSLNIGTVECNLSAFQSVIITYNRDIISLPSADLVSDFVNTAKITSGNCTKCEDKSTIRLLNSINFSITKDVSKTNGRDYKKQVTLDTGNTAAYYRVIVTNNSRNAGNVNINDILGSPSGTGRLGAMRDITYTPNVCTGTIANSSTLQCSLSRGQSVAINYARDIMNYPTSGSTEIPNTAKIISGNCSNQCNDTAKVIIPPRTSGTNDFSIEKYISKTSGSGYTKNITLNSINNRAYYKVIVKNITSRSGTVNINDILNNSTNGGSLTDMNNITFSPNVCTGDLRGGQTVSCNISAGQSVNIFYDRAVTSLPSQSRSDFVNIARINSGNCTTKCSDNAVLSLMPNYTNTYVDNVINKEVFIKENNGYLSSIPSSGVVPGQRLLYRLTFYNQGTQIATGVNITDDYDDYRLEIEDLHYSCSNSSGRIRCNTINLLPGYSAQTIEYTAIVKDTTGNIKNTAVIDQNETDVNTSNNRDDIDVELSETKLTINKTVNDYNLEDGDRATYEIEIRNRENRTRTFRLRDYISAGTDGGKMKFVSGSQEVRFYPNNTTSGYYSGKLDSNNMQITLRGDTSVRIEYQMEADDYSMDKDDSSRFKNTARILEDDIEDSVNVYIRNDDGGIYQPSGEIDLYIRKEVKDKNGVWHNADTYDLSAIIKSETNQDVDYRIFVTNEGDLTGKNIKVEDIFRSNNTSRVGMKNIKGASWDNARQTFNIPSLSAGKVATINYTATLISSAKAGEQITAKNTATIIDASAQNRITSVIYTSDAEVKGIGRNNPAYVKSQIQRENELLTFKKSVLKNTVEKGGYTEFRIIVHNKGDVDYENLVVSDYFPFQALQIIKANDLKSVDTSNGTLKFEKRFLGAGQAWIIKIRALVKNTVACNSVIVNSATITSSNYDLKELYATTDTSVICKDTVNETPPPKNPTIGSNLNLALVFGVVLTSIAYFYNRLRIRKKIH